MSCRIQHTVIDRQEGAASTHQEPALNQWAEAAGQQGPDRSSISWSLPCCPDPCHAAQQTSSAGKGQTGIAML